MPGPVVHRRGGHHIPFPAGQAPVRDERRANRADVVARTCERAGFSVNGPIYLSRDS